MTEKKWDDLKALKMVTPPKWYLTLTKVCLAFFVFLFILLTFTPWQQTSKGIGEIIALDPNDRVQNINSPVPGRIQSWHVQDGSFVKKGDPIVEVVDNDPNFIQRLRLERDAVFQKYQADKESSETALLDYERQTKLFKDGLSSSSQLEKSLITYKKLLASEASSAASLAKAEVSLSRQENQLVTAPRDGTILRVLHGSGSVVVKEGDVLAVFVPKDIQPAVEIFIDGNDLPLVEPGRHVRLQFEGWPAVQFSGWPSVAIGTFGGAVKIVDPSASYNGKFRVIVTPLEDEPWPSEAYLRQGTRALGWVLLNSVTLGYELWRQFNGFPPALQSNPKGKTRIIANDKEEDSKKKK